MSTSRIQSLPFSRLLDWRPAPIHPLLPSEDGAAGGGHADAGAGAGAADAAGAGAEDAERVTDPGSPMNPEAFLTNWGRMSGEDRATHYGYPFGTPVTEMNDTQKAGYYRAQAEKHEARNRATNYTAEDIARWRADSERVSQLEYDLGTDAQKAAADARTAAEKATADKFVPRLVATELRSQLATRGITDSDRIAEICDTLASSKSLLTPQGDDVDPAAVTKKLTALLGPTTTVGRQGPTTTGLGDRTRTTFAPGERGAAEADKRFGSKDSQGSGRQGAASGARS